MTAAALSVRPSARIWRTRLRHLPALIAMALVLAPILVAGLAGLFLGGGTAWNEIGPVRLLVHTGNTLLLIGLGGALMLLTAVPAAWLVTMHRFPGRAIFEWLLILPLAAPGYVLAYAYADLSGVAGPVQSLLREITGLPARAYWFPDMASLPGAAYVLAAGLYPYVYLAARAAFMTQSVCALEAARTLGASPWRRFFRVALPGARPAIAAGLALALMEIAADYGATSFLGVQTLTVSLFSNWKAYGDATAAARLALVLMLIVFALQAIERVQRGRAGVEATSLRWRTLSREPLSRAAGLGAALFCTGMFLWGFGLPVTRLVWLALEHRESVAPVGDALRNTVLLAAMGTAIAFLLAIIFALTQRAGSAFGETARLVAASGYAMPGAVLALGALIVTGSLTRWGWLGGLTAPVAITALLWVYASRFTAAGASALDAALARAPDSMRHAARALGAGPLRRAMRIDLPIASAGAAAGALILFVEILKELPATLMLRPFDWDTLAVRAHAYASDERLAAAALPSLLITAAGLLPVILLSRKLSQSRPGESPR